MSRLHKCPGGCGSDVRYEKYACRDCWFRLPAPLRVRLIATWKAGQLVSPARVAALADARTWYRANPLRTGKVYVRG